MSRCVPLSVVLLVAFTPGVRASDDLPHGAVIRYGTEDLRDPVANKVLYLPDGKTMVSAGWTLRVWDIRSKKMTAEYPLPGGYAMHLSCSAKGDQLYVSCNKFLVLSLTDGKVIASVEQPQDRWASTAVSADGKLLAAGGYNGEIYTWELPSGKQLAFKGRHDYADDSPLKDKKFLPVGSLSFHPSKPLLASGGRDHIVRVWDMASGAQVQAFSDQVGEKCFFTSDGKQLVTNNALQVKGYWSSSKLFFWNVETGKREREIEAPLGYSTAVSTDGKRLVTGHGCCALAVYDFESGKRLAKSEELGTSMNCVSIAPDGKTFAAVSHGLDVRDLNEFVSLSAPAGHIGMILAIKVSPDQTKLATAGADGSIRLWDIKTGREVQKLTGAKGAIQTLAFAPGEEVLASGGADGVTFWDLKSGRAVRTLPFESQVQWVEFSPDRKTLLVGCADLGIRFIDADSGKQLRTFGGYPQTGVYGRNCFLQSSDGKHVVHPIMLGKGEGEGLVTVNVESGKEIMRFEVPGERITNGTLSQDGSLFAHCGKQVVIYDTKNKAKLGTIPVAFHGEMRFSKDAKHIYLGKDCYDLATHKKLFSMPVEVDCLEFTSDGKRAFTANRARCSILGWDVETLLAPTKK